MKKYSVFDLYVVNVDEYYFICEKGYRENIYVELFTKEKFKVLDDNNIRSLKNYYSLFEVMNYKNGEELLLTKKELLIRYAHLNSAQIERRKDSRDDLIKCMDNYLMNLKEFAKYNPEKAREEAMNSLYRTGILNEDGEFSEFFTNFSFYNKDNSSEFIKRKFKK